MTFLSRSLTCIVAALALLGCRKEGGIGPVPEGQAGTYAGGETTVFITGSTAFSTPAPNLDAASLDQHLAGDTQFEQVFVTAPSDVNPGLGPLFNNTSCAGCHPADGRGRPPMTGEQMSSMLVRVSVPGTNTAGGPNPVPGFGTQLQQRAVAGTVPEGNVEIIWTTISGRYADGTAYTLRKPVLVLTGRIPDGVLVSPRIAPPVFGLGLLESVPEATILSFAVTPEAARDNISGRANYVWDVEAGTTRLGRFGWKAGTPTLLQQTAAAYVEDMGVTSPFFPVENCAGTGVCDTLKDDPEITSEILNDVAFYTQTLGVPAARGQGDPVVSRGRELFRSAGCVGCHVETMQTGRDFPVPALRGQTIHPYTDMLLHDMGPELADGRPDFLATGSEWRTPPLWGIGLTQIVSGHTFFLHDGRARDLEEAILWHGGEAASAKERFRSLPKDARSALLRFLGSL